MKSILLATALIVAGGVSVPAHARTCTPGMLGCPVHATPVPRPDVNATPVPTPSGPVPAKDIFSGLLTFQGEIVANLQQADTYEAAPLNSATPPTAFNPTAHECLVGMPGQGTAGQPGFVAPSQGLIAWVQGLTPLAGASVPPLPGPQSAACLADMAATPPPTGTPLDCVSPSPATVAVYADNQAAAALSTVSSLTSQISSGNFPGFSDLKQSCGGMLNHVRDEVTTATTDVLAIEALIAKYVVPVMAAHKGPTPEK
jgi:hypothetical protein